MSNCPFCLREDFIIQFVNCIQGVFSKDEKCVVRRDFSLCLRNSLLIFNVPVMFFPSPKHSKLNRGRRGRDRMGVGFMTTCTYTISALSPLKL
jgi:hypothetical protein